MHAIPSAHPIETLPRRREDFPDLYPEGRICGRPNCKTILCTYNPGPLCWPCGGYDTFDLKETWKALAELIAEAP